MAQVSMVMPKKLAKPKLVRTAAYCRVSIAKESNMLSLAAQVSYYNSYIKSNPQWVSAGIYADEGISGTGTERPGLQNLLREADAGHIDLILTKSISRFSRNTVDLLSIVRHLKSIGVAVLFERERIRSDSGDGELMLTLLSSFAQEESRSISENTKWTIRHNFEKGKGMCHAMRGYLIEGKAYVVNEEESALVKKVFFDYLAGTSPHEIASATGLPYSTVWNMLRNEKYAGDSLLQKTYVENHISHRRCTNKGHLPMYYVEDSHPGIISHKQFDQVQTEISRRKQLGFMAAKRFQDAVFTGMIVCGKCGGHYRRRTKGNGKNYVRYSWACTEKISHGKESCDASNLPEKQLVEMTRQIIGDKPVNRENVVEAFEKVVVLGNEVRFHVRDGRIIEKRMEKRK